MCERKRGVIVNIIGLAGERHTAQYIAGTMGNASLMAMSRALGGESPDYRRARDRHSNPGAIETDRQSCAGKRARKRNSATKTAGAN